MASPLTDALRSSRETQRQSWAREEQAMQRLQTLIGDGMAAFAQGDLVAAAACFEAGLQEFPGEAVCQFQLGLIRLLQGQAAEAVVALEAVPDDFPDVFLYRGLASHCAGDVQHAIGAFRLALQCSPNDPMVLNGIGNCMRQRSVADASAFFHDAVNSADSATLAQCHNDLGRNLIELGEVEEGVACLRLAVKHCKLPAVVPVYCLELGLALCALGRFRDAVPVLTRAADGLDETSAAHHTLGVALLETREYDECLVRLQRAQQLNPTSSWVRRAIGHRHLAAGAYPAAATAFRGAVQTEPSNADLCALLGDALRLLGDTEGAVAAYGEALQIEPDKATALAALNAVRQASRRRVAIIISVGDDSEAHVLANALALGGYRPDEVITLLGSKCSPQLVMQVLTGVVDALNAASPECAIFVYFQAGVGVYTQSSKAFLELPSGRLPVARVLSALAGCSDARHFIVFDAHPSANRLSYSSSDQEGPGPVGLLDALELHLDLVPTACAVVAAFADPAESPLADFLAAALAGLDQSAQPGERASSNDSVEARHLLSSVQQHFQDEGLTDHVRLCQNTREPFVVSRPRPPGPPQREADGL